MPTFLFDEHVFGPIKSRRLGSSLGINLLSVHQKICNFNCIYCECGLTYKIEKEEHAFVEKGELMSLLENKLVQCQKDGTPIDTITFAGNGEPTLHPFFLSIVKELIVLRDTYFPSAKIAVLTNGYTLHKLRINQALSIVDQAIVKLDAGDDHMIKLIDRPKKNIPLEKLMNNLKSFNGNLIIQTMFLRGSVKGEPFDNSTGKSLENWLEKITALNPSLVMLYSLDRDTPLKTLESVSRKELLAIAYRVKESGIKTSVV